MDYDTDKVDEVTLVLLTLNMFEEYGVTRAWKGFSWEVADRLYEKGLITNPKSKAKSVVIAEEDRRLSEEFFEKHFGKRE